MVLCGNQPSQGVVRSAILVLFCWDVFKLSHIRCVDNQIVILIVSLVASFHKCMCLSDLVNSLIQSASYVYGDHINLWIVLK